MTATLAALAVAVVFMAGRVYGRWTARADVRESGSRLARARRQQAEALALHTTDKTYRLLCRECGGYMPCPTERALRGQPTVPPVRKAS